MKVIVGLGNPELKYQNTYHNMGFLAVDNLASQYNLDFKLKKNLRCYLAEGMVAGEKFLVVKPITYMNLSGECVSKVLSYYNVPSTDMMVIYDDIDIDIGQIRYRPHGSPGTHNGMRNITLCIGTNEYKRVRVGTKPQDDSIPLVDYVLSQVPKSQFDALNGALLRAKNLVVDYLNGATDDQLMQEYNKKV